MADHCFHESGGIMGILHDHGPCGLIAKGTVIADDVLWNQTFSNKDINTGVGTMPNNGSVNYTPLGTASVTIAHGFHNASTVLQIASCTPGNIREGATIGAVPGTCKEAFGNATAADVLAPKTFSVAGNNAMTGQMTEYGAVGIAPSGSTPGSGHYTTVSCSSCPVIPCDCGEEGVPCTPVPCTAVPCIPCNCIGGTVTGTALQADVREGVTFSSTAFLTGAAGTMTNRLYSTFVPSTALQTIPSGYYDGNGYIFGDVDLVPGNIRSGVNIFGKVGATNVIDTTEGGAPANAGAIYSGAVAFVNGSKLTGEMVDRGAANFTPTSASQSISAGYYSAGTLAACSASGGVIYSGSHTFTTGLTNSGYYHTVTGLPSVPKAIFMNSTVPDDPVRPTRVYYICYFTRGITGNPSIYTYGNHDMWHHLDSGQPVDLMIGLTGGGVTSDGFIFRSLGGSRDNDTVPTAYSHVCNWEVIC